jgi:hypothetical protein
MAGVLCMKVEFQRQILGDRRAPNGVVCPLSAKRMAGIPAANPRNLQQPLAPSSPNPLPNQPGIVFRACYLGYG